MKSVHLKVINEGIRSQTSHVDHIFCHIDLRSLNQPDLFVNKEPMESIPNQHFKAIYCTGMHNGIIFKAIQYRLKYLLNL